MVEQSGVVGYAVRRHWLLTSGINSPWYFYILGMEVSILVFPRADERTGFGVFYQAMEAMGARFWKVDDGVWGRAG